MKLGKAGQYFTCCLKFNKLNVIFAIVTITDLSHMSKLFINYKNVYINLHWTAKLIYYNHLNWLYFLHSQLYHLWLITIFLLFWTWPGLRFPWSVHSWEFSADHTATYIQYGTQCNRGRPAAQKTQGSLRRPLPVGPHRIRILLKSQSGKAHLKRRWENRAQMPTFLICV